jgi:hypothetical protein
VQDVNGGPLGVHRTFLQRDGSGKATIEPPRASLGPIRGGAIRLDPAADEMVIGEGLETSASAGLLLGMPAWAGISAGNLGEALKLPASVRSVVIAADPDEPGRKGARAAWHRWHDEGRRVRISTPHAGLGDCNDILVRRLAGRSA